MEYFRVNFARIRVLVTWLPSIVYRCNPCRLCFTVTPSTTKTQTSQYRKARIWEMKENKYIKRLAKNQVCAITPMRDIRKNVLSNFIRLFYFTAKTKYLKSKYPRQNQSYFVFAVKYLVLPWQLWATIKVVCFIADIKALMERCINLPSPPLPKGDFAPFREMYLTSGIISCWNAARCDSHSGINGLLGFSHYYPINYKYPHFWFQHSLVCWLLFLILVWVDRVKIREIILRNNLNFNDRRHRQQEICADRLVLNLLLFLLLLCH